MTWPLLLTLSHAEPVTLVPVDPHGRLVEEATWRTPAGELAVGKTTVDLPIGHHTLAVTAEGFFGSTVELDVAEGRPGEVQVILGASQVVLTDRRIVIHDAIYFETNKAVIKPESHELCRQTARLMIEHPEVLLVSVEGHADERGGDSFNLDLSTRRAAAVKAFLEANGVSAQRLRSTGWGEQKPVVEGSDEEAWSQNRRVEFLVVERAD
ncbi:MAG: OmpA family protein [Proteobacteria bacterium]|nr:OmpA family protein [Pseudomonadota bacterium]MCP4916741.1 OmpA family protein [Pseudomonadota bacterium]